MRPKILFLCTGNSCRSQMAEGWAHHLLGDQADFFSAGIETHGLNPNAVAAMHEAGVDITQQESHHVEPYLESGLDLVISVCPHAQENCPAFSSRTQVAHVPFDDPPKLAREPSVADPMQPYRRVCAEIQDFVSQRLPGMIRKLGEAPAGN